MNVSNTVCLALLASSATAQAAWTHLYPATAPSWRNSHAMAYDAVRNQVLLFGGQAQSSSSPLAFNDLWSWNGSQWLSILATNAPTARAYHRIAYDSTRGVVVLYGGSDALFNDLTDTWELAGNQWTQCQPAHHPSAREDFGMIFDAARGRTVLFGGLRYSIAFGDTWEWNGTDWLQRVTPTAPLPRSQAGLAFDPMHGVSVLFGGYAQLLNGNFLVVSDTWTWDGTAWQVQTPANAPPPSNQVDMTFDSARARMVAYGLSDGFTWEWDGQNWHIVLVASPGQRGPMAYDEARREVVFYGTQYQPGGLQGDTWVYATTSPATFTTYGNGCAGSAGVPVLANAPYSLPWLGDTFRARATSLASSISTVVFATGLASTLPVDLAPYGMPGCHSLVDTSIIALDFVATAANAAEWSIAVPNSTALNGAHIYQQAIALEAGANAAGAIVSNAGDIGVGIR